MEALVAGAFKLKVESKKGKVIQFALGRIRSSEMSNPEWKPLQEQYILKKTGLKNVREVSDTNWLRKERRTVRRILA